MRGFGPMLPRGRGGWAGGIHPDIGKHPRQLILYTLHTLLEIHIFKTTIHHAKFQLSSLKKLDVTDLQTFGIIWSQVISARHNKGNMEVFSDKWAIKI